jgi:hypothetical protein
MISPFPERSTLSLSSDLTSFHSIGSLTYSGNGAYDGHTFATGCKPLLTLCVLTPNLGVREWVNRGRGRHGADGPGSNKFDFTGG